MKNILVICELNFARSITVEYLLKKRIQKENLEIKVESAGLFSSLIKRNSFENILYCLRDIPPLSKKRLTKEKAENADLILVMDYYMITALTRDYGQSENKIICLDIPRRYSCPYTPSLVNLVKERLDEIQDSYPQLMQRN